MKPLTVDGTAGTAYRLVDPWLLPVAVQPDRMQAAVDQRLADAAREPDGRRAARSRSLAGFMCICLHRPTEAVQILGDCALAQAMLEDWRGLIATELRLVQALQASNQIAAALETAHAALARSTAEPSGRDLQHVAQHHLGKVQLQAGLYDEARRHLLLALDARQRAGDDELVASTQAALSRWRQVTANPGP